MVAPPDRGAQAERLIGMIVAADRPMRIFRNVRKARRWLDGQPSTTASADRANPR
jgi:hypothetical protein